MSDCKSASVSARCLEEMLLTEDDASNASCNDLAEVIKMSETISAWAKDKLEEKKTIEDSREAVNSFMHDFRYEYEGARDTDSIENWTDDWLDKNYNEDD